MSRSGYSEDCDDVLMFGRWNAQVNSAIRGKRGQKFLLDLVNALDALPEPKLISDDLEQDGAYCALGALGKYRGIDLDNLDTYEYEKLGSNFDIAEQLARETMYINDECGSKNDGQRWQTVRNWALSKLSKQTLIGQPEIEIE